MLESLGMGGACEGCSGCDGAGAGDPLKTYADYIEGKKELTEITAGFSKGGSVR